METWEIPKETGETIGEHEETYGKIGETCRESPLGRFLNHLVTSFQATS